MIPLAIYVRKFSRSTVHYRLGQLPFQWHVLARASFSIGNFEVCSIPALHMKAAFFVFKPCIDLVQLLDPDVNRMEFKDNHISIQRKGHRKSTNCCRWHFLFFNI